MSVGQTPQSHCGTVTIAGRPNVGKSTLLNQLLGQKLAITANKPQTTRHRLLGVLTHGSHQVLLVDTPGIHVGGRSALNQVLNRTANSALQDVDLALLLVQALEWRDDDQRAFEFVSQAGIAFMTVVNKVDTVRDKSALLPWLANLPQHERNVGTYIISARKGSGTDDLLQAILQHMPEASWRYGEDEISDRSLRFFASEAVREALTRQLDAELPYALDVEVERFEESPDLTRIGAVIWVEKDSQKGIVIGKGGLRLREVGRAARQSIESLIQTRVHLELWVRVRRGWADDERSLRQLGYDAG